MAESQLFLEWMAEARREGEVEVARTWPLRVLDFRFPGVVPADVRELVTQQESPQMLHDWFKVAIKAFSIESFRAHVLR